MSNKQTKKGFTLVELLVVIAILAVLTAAVIVVLNPGELLKQSRDAQRMGDFDAVRSAINLYLSLTTSTTPFGASSLSQAMISSSTGDGGCYYHSNGIVCTVVSSTAVDSTGWIPVNFKDGTFVNMSPPLSNLPTDPSNTATYHYAIGTDATNKYYVIKSILESSKYSTRMATYGNASTSLYEVGNAPGLNL